MAGAAVEFSDNTWDAEVLQSDKPVLVDFWAPWCAPCRMLAPTIEKLATEYAGKVKVGKLNTDDNRDAASNFRVSSIPTVIFFKGGKEVGRLVGVNPEARFKSEIEKLLEG